MFKRQNVARHLFPLERKLICISILLGKDHTTDYYPTTIPKRVYRGWRIFRLLAIWFAFGGVIFKFPSRLLTMLSLYCWRTQCLKFIIWDSIIFPRVIIIYIFALLIFNNRRCGGIDTLLCLSCIVEREAEIDLRPPIVTTVHRRRYHHRQ